MATQTAVSTDEVFVVDDDPDMRDLLALIFSLEGYRVASFADGRSMLAAALDRVPRCILLDVVMPEMSGLDVLKALDPRHYRAPVVMVSGRADIHVAVEAIRCGAADFVEKPFNAAEIIATVAATIETWRRDVGGDVNPIGTFEGEDLLTPREREVLTEIAGGASNKEAGQHLGISPRTIEVHRARIMNKLHARNAADLVRKVLAERIH